MAISMRRDYGTNDKPSDETSEAYTFGDDPVADAYIEEITFKQGETMPEIEIKSDFVECSCGHAYEDHMTIVDGQLVNGPCRRHKLETVAKGNDVVPIYIKCGCPEPQDPNDLPHDVRCRWSFDVTEEGEVRAPIVEGTPIESDALDLADFLMRDYAERAEADGQAAAGPVMAADMLARYRQVSS